MAHSQHHGARSRPLSVEEVVREAESFEFTVNRPMRQWLRSGRQLLTEADLCEDDDNLQMAYLYLYRHADLILAKLPQHPDYRDPRYKDDLALARRALKHNLQKLEQWKPTLKRNHDRYMLALAQRAASEQRSRSGPADDERRRRSVDLIRRMSVGQRTEASEQSTIALDPAEHRQMALQLAQREYERREAARSLHAWSRDDYFPGVSSTRNTEHVQDDAFDAVREAGRRIDQRVATQPSFSSQYQTAEASRFSYPSVAPQQPRNDLDAPSYASDRLQVERSLPPARPMKQPLYDPQRPMLPARPTKDPLYDSTLTNRNDAPPVPSKQKSDVNASEPPSRYAFESSAQTESGVPLRTVFLPTELRTTFLNAVHGNTNRNLETCGILCGSLISNALFINHLIIPGQTSTSDTCDTTEDGDNALFDYCDGNKLLVCGWIHTHPSQTCFLSSRDLHTCSGYQIMLAEAIAIVCSPRHMPDWGIFRLTDPPGLRHILDCKQTGIFHPHSESNLYTDALRPGHVVEAPGMKFELIDMRM